MLPKQITSLQHDIVKYLTKLRKQKRFRDKNKSFLVVGESIIEELAPLATFKKILSTTKKNRDHILISQEIYAKITGHDAKEGMIAEVQMPHISREIGDSILYLDDIQDPGNFGTILRTAVAFGISQVLYTEGCSDPYNEKALQSGRGAQLKIPLLKSNAENLAQQKHTKYAATLSGTSLQKVAIEKPYVLILGNEGHGVSKKAAEHALPVTIPIQNMESLNVAAAAAILLYHAEHVAI